MSRRPASSEFKAGQTWLYKDTPCRVSRVCRSGYIYFDGAAKDGALGPVSFAFVRSRMKLIPPGEAALLTQKPIPSPAGILATALREICQSEEASPCIREIARKALAEAVQPQESEV